jgi:hypothetical protein
MVGMGKTYGVEQALARAGQHAACWAMFPARPTMRLVAVRLFEQLTRGHAGRSSRFALTDQLVEELAGRPRVAEMVDGVIGVDTHRDFNQVEIARSSGAVIATRTFTNDSAGHAETLAWVVKHAPGPRLVLSIEGTRSYGVGLARAAATAGLR